MTTEKTSIYCPYCHRHTALSVADGKYRSDLNVGESLFFNDNGKWWIGVCNNCRKCVLVREPHKNSEYFEIEIYPHPLPKEIDGRSPDFVRKDFEDANKCLSISAYRATCALTRRILQMICLDKGADENKKLQEQIDELFDKGVITNEIKNWAHSVRYVGNDAIHPNRGAPPIEIDEAQDMLNLVEQMINILYIMPAISRETQEKFKKKTGNQIKI